MKRSQGSPGNALPLKIRKLIKKQSKALEQNPVIKSNLRKQQNRFERKSLADASKSYAALQAAAEVVCTQAQPVQPEQIPSVSVDQPNTQERKKPSLLNSLRSRDTALSTVRAEVIAAAATEATQTALVSRVLLENNTSGKIVQFDSEEEQILWTEYTVLKESGADQQALKPHESKIFKHYDKFCRKEAGAFAKKVPSGAVIQGEDCEAAAMAGLFDAIKAYNPRAGVKFEVFARLRIRGEMLDQLRQMQNFPRSIAKARRSFKPIIAQLANKLHKKPTREEITDHLKEKYAKDDETLKSYLHALSDPLMHCDVFNEGSSRIVRSGGSGDSNSSEDRLISAQDLIEDYRGKDNDLERRHYFIDLVQTVLCDERKKTIVFGYYFFGMTHRKIAHALGLSTSSVVVDMKKAIEELRMKLRKHKDRLRQEC